MKLRFLIAVLALSLSASGAQIPEDRGLSGLKQVLDRLDVVASVLHTGAHPDDENSSLLAWLSRGQGARTAYLSATRGEGGQNLIGTELFEALGVIRTEELLAARAYDRAQQFFTPNYEFGFSKTADETLDKWGRDALVGDFVRVIRRFRPEVIISRFSGTPADGHGHHQAAGIATMEAFHAAADPDLYPEYGPPWQAKKLYMSARGGRGGDAVGDVRINVGEYGAALGRSYHEVAMEGRSLHRTQSMGQARERGPRFTGLDLVEQLVPGDAGDPIFDGTLQRLGDLRALDPSLGRELDGLQQRIDDIRQRVTLRAPTEILPDLVAMISELERIRQKSTVEHVQFVLGAKAADFHEAAQLAAGLDVEVLVSDDAVVAGQEFDLTVAVTNNGPFDFSEIRTTIEFPSGWETDYRGDPVAVPSGERIENTFKVTVAGETPFTQPYWLRESREGDRFVWPAGAFATQPFELPLLFAETEVAFEDGSFTVPTHAEYRWVDEVLGERRSLLSVVPAVSVSLAPEGAVVPLPRAGRKEFTVTLHSEAPAGGAAEVRLVTPPGWSVSPTSDTVQFSRSGETVAIPFVVDVPNEPGEFEVSASVEMDGRSYDRGYSVIAYPHIETRRIYSDATSRVSVFPLVTEVDNVGYIEGAGDRVADALRQLDVPVSFLTSEDLSRGDLSVFDTIVLGIRAYAVRDDLRAYNQRLLDYVEAGGTVIVQYNTYQILDDAYGPYPFTINRPHDRVTVEDAPVTFVAPDHSLLNFPNTITVADFEGWVQERGLYFMGDWDERYTPVLASNDPGEDPKLGGMMVAEFGRGRYVYTGYAFFRQLPAGIPGAYRLFSNLISLGN
jgi:LmbE family N-acetylglucosaminyl deacetylase